MKENIGKSVIFWVVLIFTIWAVYWNIGSVLFTIVAALLLLGSLSSFFLPTNYSLNDKGVRSDRLFHHRSMSWDRVRSISLDGNGMFLSPFPSRTRLENFRGLFLPFRQNKETIIETVHQYKSELLETQNENDAVEETRA